MERKFTVLRTIAVLFKLIAWVFLILAIIGFVVSLVGVGIPGQRGGGGVAVLILIGGFIYFLFIYAWAELIHLFLSIEEHIRALTHQLTKKE